MNTTNIVFRSKDNSLLHNAVKQLVQGKVKDIDRFNINIDQKDEMFLNPVASYKQTHPNVPEQKRQNLAVLRYVNVGIEILDIVKQLVDWKFGGFDKIDTFIDFACGYGRFTRLLVQHMPAHKVWVSDIYQEAVSFQRNQFGVNGVVSHSNPDDFAIDERFDCILVVSLFSHLPEKTFSSWLKKLYGLLSPGGMMMFSVIDETLKKPDVVMSKKGFGYVKRSESRTLNVEDYGGAFVSESYVSEAIYNATNGKDKYHRLPRGICNHQDLYVLVNGDVDFSMLEVKMSRPFGHFGSCVLKENNLHVSGWAVTLSPDTCIKDIQIIVNGKMIQRCMPFDARHHVVKRFNDERHLISGWNCSCFLDRDNSEISTDILTIRLVSSDNTEKIIFSGTIEEALNPNRIKRSI